MTTKLPTLDEAIGLVTESGAQTASHERVTEVIRAICVPGFHLRQGDVKLTFVCDAENAEVTDLKVTQERQLAIGETKGSRHILEGDATIYARENDDGFTGPMIVTNKARAIVTHPEHRHYVLPADTCWSVEYAKDEATKQRVQD